MTIVKNFRVSDENTFINNTINQFKDKISEYDREQEKVQKLKDPEMAWLHSEAENQTLTDSQLKVAVYRAVRGDGYASYRDKTLRKILDDPEVSLEIK